MSRSSKLIIKTLSQDELRAVHKKKGGQASLPFDLLHRFLAVTV